MNGRNDIKVIEIDEGMDPKELGDAFEIVKIARHPERPYTLDYIERLFPDFIELRGDRRYADDPAMVCGLATFQNLPVVIIGQQKGRDTKQRRFRNFGMPKPEGYRKAIRLMRFAEKFGHPIITFIDTPGAYPGIDAEERGQAEAIANNLIQMARISVPIIISIIGEGGSGGALAIGVGDSVLMQENAIYSVISPEGCAAILWKDSSKSKLAAESLRLTARDLFKLKIIDEVVEEPGRGAHESFDQAALLLGRALRKQLKYSLSLKPSDRLARRYQRIRSLGC